MNVYDGIRALVAYGLRKSLITEDDVRWTANSLLDALKLEPDGDFDPRGGEELPLEEILKVLLDDAVARGVIEDGITSRDLFDTRLMGILTPRPGEVVRTFRNYMEESPASATNYFYQLAGDSDYIRRYRIAKDVKWVSPTKYGNLDITINLSKPEKDPKAIAAALTKKQNAYPRCLLCPENEGYAGRMDHPARQNIRLIPLTLDGEDWFMQYSPYVYYNEHCIVLSAKHVPMKISRSTFVRLLQFVRMFPHYTIGSNADLPIVGGSILTHEHFQGGRYTFAMARAAVRQKLNFRGFEDVEAGIVNWSMSVIRLDGRDPDRLVELANIILEAWREYSDPERDIYAYTEETPHNTITPIARRIGDFYELDLVLRNNRTTEQYPLGIFHPHEELHHIKKENIGLIEVMGLAVLPSRLLKELRLLGDTICGGRDVGSVPELAAHAPWAAELLEKYPAYAPRNVAATMEENQEAREKLDGIIRGEVGHIFSRVLEDCAVFKDTEDGRAGFQAFTDSVRP